MAASTDNIYPPVSFFFRVKFDGIGSADVDYRFQEVTGFNQELGTEDLAEGGNNRFAYRMPTRGKFGNLVLKRGVMVESGLVDWIRDAIDEFTFKPVDIIVTLQDEEDNPVITWNFYRAYPVKWTTSDLKAMENALLVETIELAYQYFTKTYN